MRATRISSGSSVATRSSCSSRAPSRNSATRVRTEGPGRLRLRRTHASDSRRAGASAGLRCRHAGTDSRSRASDPHEASRWRLAALLVLAGCGSAEPAEWRRRGEHDRPRRLDGRRRAPATRPRSTQRQDHRDGRPRRRRHRRGGQADRCRRRVRQPALRQGRGGLRGVQAPGRRPAGHQRLRHRTSPVSDGQLLVTRADHPRGGYQLRVYAADGRRARPSSTVDGQPLVPFVATDVQEHPSASTAPTAGWSSPRRRPRAGRRASDLGHPADDVRRRRHDGHALGRPRRSPTTCCPRSSARSTPSWSSTPRSRAAGA